jgi:hypothetical protein
MVDYNLVNTFIYGHLFLWLLDVDVNLLRDVKLSDPGFTNVLIMMFMSC